MGYRWNTGSLAWLLHRISGVALALYIIAHLFVLSNLRDPGKFNSIMETMHNPLVKLAEVGLLALVAWHALNGVRVTFLEAGVAGRYQKHMFWTALAAAFLVIVAGGLIILPGGAQ